MRVLITGASSGIGRALAVELARRGRHVIVSARRQHELKSVAEQIRAAGGRADVLVLDAADTERMVAVLREQDANLEIDTVVANAGVGAKPNQDPSSWEAIAEAFHINYCGAAATLTALFPRMIARDRGHLVGVGSISSFGALPGAAAYCSPKAGVNMLLECLRLDARGTQVAVTALHLGFVDTKMLAHANHPTPQLVSTSTAARVISDAMDRRVAEFTYPRALGLAASLAGGLPRSLRGLLSTLDRKR